ncbi:flavin-nucleotide-binding protein [Roseibium salinum]|nr:flavin-nucleotide-binding protein [Roseibium salinum]
MLERDFNALARDGASPFHEGERIVQERLGVRKVEEWARKAIRSFMPDQHREFFEAQPFLIMAARDAEGRPWATLVEGDDGFVRSPDPTSLEIRSRPVHGDALEGAFQPGADLAILGIELATRRRNRANGRIGRADGETIDFKLDQSFGNCPQYIRARDIWRSPDEPAPRVVRGTRLSASQKRWIGTANTFFIGTGYRGEGDNPAFGLDVSHRGGERGFVEVPSDSRIRFPDYAGNDYYNTLGNILKDARTGLLFLDFFPPAACCS